MYDVSVCVIVQKICSPPPLNKCKLIEKSLGSACYMDLKQAA